jgi:hypothetical protein
MPRNSGLAGNIRGRKVGRLFDGKCHRKSDRHRRKPVVRVKRCGKSAPREAQATRHGKPHRVQGQIGNRGAARSVFRESETGFGYRSLRQMILSVPLAGCRQNSAYSLSKTNYYLLGGQSKSGLRLSGISGEVFCGNRADKTVGALKLPTRFTARMEMASGARFSKR